MTKLADLKKQWMQDPKFKEEYDKLDIEFEVAKQFIKARKRAKMTQNDVAKAMNTRQSVISRLESGKGTCTLDTLNRFAKVVGMKPKIEFVPSKELN